MRRVTIALLMFIGLAWGQITTLPNAGGGGGGGGAPSGAAGGALAGTYPDPTLAYNATNPQTGTTYAILTGDRSKLVTLTNDSAIAVSIAACGSTGFPDGWETTLLNSGAGTATITPTTSTIEGAATLALTTGQAVKMWCNAANNYRAARLGKAAAATVADSTTGNAGGTAAGLAAQYVDWNAASGGASIANKPTLGTASAATLGTGAGQVPVTGEYQPADTDLATIAALECTENQIQKRNGAGAWVCAADADTGAGATDMTQAVENSADNSVSVGVGTSGRAFEKTPFTIDPATGNASTPGTISSGSGGTVAGQYYLYELVANGNNFRSWLAPDALTADLQLKHADGLPAGSVMTFPTPTGTVSQYSWTNYAEAATASTIPIRNASGELIAANTVATGKTAMATDTVLAAAQTAMAMTPTSVLATGIVSGTAPIAINTGSDPCPTGTHCTFGTTYKSGYVFNQQTAADRIYIDLPTAAAGLQWCIKNSVVGGTGAAVTGIITVKAQTGDYINNDGTIGSTGGVLSSAGAAGDGACFVASAANHWETFVSKGTWAP